MASPSNVEDLVGLASRVSSLPDESLAQLTQQEGIESLIAATEMKDREVTRAEAAAQPQENTTVLDNLIQRAIGVPNNPMGITGNPMDIPQDPMMMQANVPQTGMRNPPLSRMPENTMPELAPEMLRQQVPAARVGGLIRKFDNGGQFAYNPYFQEALAQTFQGMTPQELIAAGADPSQIQRASGEYAQRLQETPESIASVYNPLVVEQRENLLKREEMGRNYGYVPPEMYDQPIIPQKSLDEYHQEQARTGLETDPYFGGAQALGLPTRGGKLDELTTRFFPAGVEPTEFSQPIGGPDMANIGSGNLVNTVDGGASATTTPPVTGAGDGVTPPNQVIGGPQYGASVPKVDPLVAGATLAHKQQQQVLSQLISSIPNPLGLDATETSTRTELSNFEAEESNRIKELGEEIDQYMLDLDELEEGIPDRDSIKNRIKTQTNLGLAQAFFNAAEKGSPDFITAMAGAFGDASGVMNKMTGQEQKEIYQHAVDAFNRKATRANASFTRRQGLLTEQNRRATTAATTRTNFLAALREANDLAQAARDYNFQVYTEAKESARDARDHEQALRDWVAGETKNYNDTVGTLSRDVQTGVLVDMPQHQRANALLYAQYGVEPAQVAANIGIDRNLEEVNELYKAAVEAGTSADPLADAWNQWEERVEDSGITRYGDRALMTQLRPSLEAVMQRSRDDSGQINQAAFISNLEGMRQQDNWNWLDIGSTL